MKVEPNLAIILKQYQESFPKDFKLGKVEGKKSDGLIYYLKSIPNNKNVKRTIWKYVGWCISKITKNSEEGLQMWADWTKPYGVKYNVDELRNEYESHSFDKGYGWKTLYQMAMIFNKNMEQNDSFFTPLFDDKPSFKCEKQKQHVLSCYY